MITIKKTVCPDATLTLNTNSFLTVASGSTTDISLVDQNDSDITPISLTGGTIKVNVPTSAVGADILKTGQTISQATGDDGDIQAGRATDFLTLESNNPFGNTNRFTTTSGTAGTPFTNQWIIDWSTYNGTTVLGYVNYWWVYGLKNWADAVSYCNSFTLDTYSGCRLANIRELQNIIDYGNSNFPFQYAPFNSGVGSGTWSSTSVFGFTTLAFEVVHTLSQCLYTNKTNTRYAMPVRNFTNAELGI